MPRGKHRSKHPEMYGGDSQPDPLVEIGIKESINRSAEIAEMRLLMELMQRVIKRLEDHNDA